MFNIDLESVDAEFLEIAKIIAEFRSELQQAVFGDYLEITPLGDKIYQISFLGAKILNIRISDGLICSVWDGNYYTPQKMGHQLALWVAENTEYLKEVRLYSILKKAKT